MHPDPEVGLSHGALVLSAASLSTQGVDVEHTAELQGVRYACSLQRETSEYYRVLTPALERLVRTARGCDQASRAGGGPGRR